MPFRIGNAATGMLASGSQIGAKNSLASILQRLSTGKRINSASDDPAGLAVASSLDVSRRILNQGVRNLNDGISALNIADSALSQLKAITERQRELAQQSANGTYTNVQRLAFQKEVNALVSEFNRIVSSTEFNGETLLTTDSDRLNLQAGTGDDGILSLSMSEDFQRTVGTGSYTGGVTGGFTSARGIASADFTGDGNLDLAVAGTGPGIGLLTGAGDGSFAVGTTALSSPVGTYFSLTQGDLNGDGQADLVAGTNLGTAEVFLNTGGGTFTSPARGVAEVRNIYSYPAGSITEGAYFYISSPSRTYYVWINKGGATDPRAGEFGIQVNICITDPDFVVASKIAGALTATGEFSCTAAGSVTTATNVATGAAVDGTDGGGSGVNIGAPTTQGVTAQNNYTTGLNSFVQLADMNNDSVLDIVSVGQNTIDVWFGNGNGTFASRANKVVSGANFSTSPTIGDVNGDGNLDILACDSTGQRIITVLGTGTKALGAVSQLSVTGAAGVTSGDFDGDDKLDIAVGTASNVLVYSGNGVGGFTFDQTLAALTNGARSPQAADLNGDGYLDLISSTSLQVFLNDRNGSFSNAMSLPGSVTNVAGRAATGDFNEDGATDIALSHLVSSKWTTWLGVPGSEVIMQRLDVTSRSSALEAIAIIDDTQERIQRQLSAISAGETRAAIAAQVAGVTALCAGEASNRITDADIAQETSAMVRAQLLENINSFIVGHSKLDGQTVLKLLS